MKSIRRFIVVLVVGICMTVYSAVYIMRQGQHNDLVANNISEPNGKSSFAVYTNGCKINNLDPWDTTIQKYVSQPSGPLICASSNHAEIVYQHDNWLRINRTAMDTYIHASYCTYAPFTRVEGDDNAYLYLREKGPFNEDTQIDDEFIRVSCYNNASENIYTKFLAFVLLNHTKEESRRGIFKEYIKSKKPIEKFNVLLMGVDSMSRSNFIRQMPKTVAYLKTELGAIDFNGYNKVGDNTFPNIVPMLSGKSVPDLPWSEKDRRKPFDKYNLLWKDFSAVGYSTMFAEYLPKGGTFNYLMAGFHKQPTDYYLRPFYVALEAEYYRINKHCLGYKLDTEIVLYYLWDVLRAYRNRKIPHFILTFITDLSHDVINSASLADHLYEGLLKKYKSYGHYKNTILVFFSDHGIRFGDIRSTTVGNLEGLLPGLYLVVPSSFHHRYPLLSKNLQTNSRRLVTLFDVYETLKNVLGFNGQSKENDLTTPGISLFSEIPDNRTCADAAIPVHYCSCYGTSNVSVSDTNIVSATSVTLDFINQLTNEYRKICAKLELTEIIKAVKLILDFKDDTPLAYQITFQVEPSKGIFESTVMKSEGKWNLMGDVSRINKYGNQSACVHKRTLIKFCYCVG